MGREQRLRAAAIERKDLEPLGMVSHWSQFGH
jgi:hypothetical protein